MGDKSEIADELDEVLVLFPKKFALELLSMKVKMLGNTARTLIVLKAVGSLITSK
jgi:hypothetical protein